jgi:hypothetical protein
MTVTEGLKDMKVAEIAKTMQQNAGRWHHAVLTVSAGGRRICIRRDQLAAR